MEKNDQAYRPTIAIGVITRCREAGLTRALEGIARQQLSGEDCGAIRVFVIDNDPAGSAAAVCDRLRSGYPWALEYALEPITGIPHARNRAIEMAIPTSDFLVYLDDDEVPSDGWLAELLRVWREYSSDVVLGPVAHYFPESVPKWIERGRFFERRKFPTGTECTIGWSGNVLMSTRMLKESGLRFDEGYRFTGGSDVVFFRQVCEAGYRMVWADDAMATEWIPKSRTTLRWLLTRYFRLGVLDARDLSLWRRCRAGAIGTARVLIGASCSALLLPFSQQLSVKAIRWSCYGVGLLYGVAGGKFDEYSSVRNV